MLHNAGLDYLRRGALAGDPWVVDGHDHIRHARCYVPLPGYLPNPTRCHVFAGASATVSKRMLERARRLGYTSVEEMRLCHPWGGGAQTYDSRPVDQVHSEEELRSFRAVATEQTRAAAEATGVPEGLLRPASERPLRDRVSKDARVGPGIVNDMVPGGTGRVFLWDADDHQTRVVLGKGYRLDESGRVVRDESVTERQHLVYGEHYGLGDPVSFPGPVAERWFGGGEEVAVSPPAPGVTMDSAPRDPAWSMPGKPGPAFGQPPWDRVFASADEFTAAGWKAAGWTPEDGVTTPAPPPPPGMDEIAVAMAQPGGPLHAPAEVFRDQDPSSWVGVCVCGDRTGRWATEEDASLELAHHVRMALAGEEPGWEETKLTRALRQRLQLLAGALGRRIQAEMGSASKPRHARAKVHRPPGDPSGWVGVCLCGAETSLWTSQAAALEALDEHVREAPAGDADGLWDENALTESLRERLRATSQAWAAQAAELERVTGELAEQRRWVGRFRGEADELRREAERAAELRTGLRSQLGSLGAIITERTAERDKVRARLSGMAGTVGWAVEVLSELPGVDADLIREQTDQVIKRLAATLEGCGFDLGELLR